MKGSISLGHLWGIHIRIHLTFLLVLIWIGWVGWSFDGWSSGLWAILLMLSLFLCVFLHELGHSVVALRFGVKVRSITLLPIGGVASMSRIPEKPGQELAIAVAGPLVNVVIASLILLWRGGWPSLENNLVIPSNWSQLIDELLRANLMLIVFNSIPAFPMDGGRILRSLLAWVMPYVYATAIAAWIGQFMACLFFVLGFFVNPFLMLIGFFVFWGARAESKMVRVRHQLSGKYVKDAMRSNPMSLSAEDSLGKCVSLALEHNQIDYPVVSDDRVVGLLPSSVWLAAIRRRGPVPKAGQLMLRRFISVHPGMALEKLYQDLNRISQPFFPVLENGQLVGVVSVADIQSALEISSRSHAHS